MYFWSGRLLTTNRLEKVAAVVDNGVKFFDVTTSTHGPPVSFIINSHHYVTVPRQPGSTSYKPKIYMHYR